MVMEDCKALKTLYCIAFKTDNGKLVNIMRWEEKLYFYVFGVNATVLGGT